MVIDFIYHFYYIFSLFILGVLVTAFIAYFVFKAVRHARFDLKARAQHSRGTSKKESTAAKAAAHTVEKTLILLTVLVLVICIPSYSGLVKEIGMEYQKLGFDLSLMGYVLLGISFLIAMVLLFIKYFSSRLEKWKEGEKNKLYQASILANQKSPLLHSPHKSPSDKIENDQSDLFPMPADIPSYMSHKHPAFNRQERQH